MTFPTRRPISAAPRSGRLVRVVAAAMGARSSSVAGQQLLPLALPLGGQQGIAAHDQPFAGKLLAGDLGEVPLVEQRRRHRAGGQQFADHRRAQRGDPAQAVHARLVLADARRGQHAPVAHQRAANRSGCGPRSTVENASMGTRRDVASLRSAPSGHVATTTIQRGPISHCHFQPSVRVSREAPAPRLLGPGWR